MIITLQNHCKSPPFASNTDYTTKEVNWQGAIPPTTLEVGESLLNHVERIKKRAFRPRALFGRFIICHGPLAITQALGSRINQNTK